MTKKPLKLRFQILLQINNNEISSSTNCLIILVQGVDGVPKWQNQRFGDEKNVFCSQKQSFKTFSNCFVFKLVIFLKFCYFWINKQTLFLEGFGHSGAFALASRSMLYIIKILKNFTGFEELVRAYFTKELCMNKKSIDRRKRSRKRSKSVTIIFDCKWQNFGSCI